MELGREGQLESLVETFRDYVSTLRELPRTSHDFRSFLRQIKSRVLSVENGIGFAIALIATLLAGAVTWVVLNWPASWSAKP